jgi:hypothetical protein
MDNKINIEFFNLGWFQFSYFFEKKVRYNAKLGKFIFERFERKCSTRKSLSYGGLIALMEGGWLITTVVEPDGLLHPFREVTTL